MAVFSYNINRSSRTGNYSSGSWGTSIRSTAELGKTPLYSGVFSQNGKTVRYFSGNDAEIYFEDQYIDDIVQIQFSVQQNVMPLVGYNSYVYDELALGSRMIQGSFAINFTRAEYLMEILETLKATTSISDGEKSQMVISEKQNTLDELVEKDNQTKNNSSSDEVVQWRTNPLWNNQFNLIMSYGNYASKSAGSTLVVLNGVQITSCSQQLSFNGESLLEFYTFVARDIQFAPKGTSSNETPKNTENKSNATSEAAVSITNLIYTEEKDSSNKATGYLSFDVSVTENFSLSGLLFTPNVKVEAPKYDKVAISAPSEALTNSSQKVKISDGLRQDIVSSGVKTFQVNFMATLTGKSGGTINKSFSVNAKVV